MTRAEATRAAAAVIGRWVPDVGGLCLLLADAGLGRLAAALRAQGGDKRGAPRERGAPDAEVWDRQAGKVIGR